jgi:hypothetical protein
MSARCFSWSLSAGLGLALLPSAALALPFDPTPAAFERWLNQRSRWPQATAVRFSELRSCSDQSVRSSPYRRPVFTCLAGEVRIQTATGSQRCQLKRVSYTPSTQEVRYWTTRCQ